MSKRYPLDFKRHTGHKLKTQLLPQSAGAHPTLKFIPMWFLPILQPVCKLRSQAMAAMAGSLAGYTAAQALCSQATKAACQRTLVGTTKVLICKLSGSWIFILRLDLPMAIFRKTLFFGSMYNAFFFVQQNTDKKCVEEAEQ